MDNRYDAIVIGSGIGGLTTASILARIANKRVLLLERHFKFGGFTHIFKRHEFAWDVGIHYIGGMEPGSTLRQMVDWLTGGKVEWNRMRDPFERFIYPDFQFEVSSPGVRYQQDLKERWPDESAAIDRYFEDVKAAASWFGRSAILKAMPSILSAMAAPLSYVGKKQSLLTTHQYLHSRFRSAELKAVLASQWGDYGLPPKQSAFAIHALIVSHYLEGAYYPVGGAGTLAHSIVPQLEQFGGKALLYQDVQEILTENGGVRGVRVQHRQGDSAEEIEYLAPLVISDAGLKNTMLRMLPETEFSFKKELADFSQGTSNVTLYLGLKENPASLGLRGENLWIYNSLDHDRNFADRNRLLQGKPAAMYASFPSMKDPAATSHTAELISFLDYQPFSDWSGREWKNRGADYEQLKQRIQANMLERMEDVVGGFSNLVAYAELSTPLTNEHFSGHPRGSIYGLACTPDRFKSKWIGVNTPLKGLYITGADAASPGFAGAMMGGFGCAARIIGFQGIRKLFQQMGNKSRK